MSAMTEELLTISMAARLVARSPATLRRWVGLGLLNCRRDSSGRRLFESEQVLEAAAGMRAPGSKRNQKTGRFAGEGG